MRKVVVVIEAMEESLGQAGIDFISNAQLPNDRYSRREMDTITLNGRGPAMTGVPVTTSNHKSRKVTMVSMENEEIQGCKRRGVRGNRMSSSYLSKRVIEIMLSE